MTVHGVLAQATVTDLAASEPWYTALFERGPDTRPMSGLIEWYVTPDMGVQVWADPQRAGRSAMVLRDTDLDATAARLTAAGIDHEGPEPITEGRVLQLTDPDGNQVVLGGA